MALESLVDKIFSIKTDVWGFGVAVWETLSYGAIPYGDMKNIDVEENLKKGVRNKYKSLLCSVCNSDIKRCD